MSRQDEILGGKEFHERIHNSRLIGAAEPQPRKRFFTTLDGIRGVAASVVTFCHIQQFFGVNGAEGYLAVDIFFLLSGVVIANAYESRLQSGLSVRMFVKIRLIRFYPLYIFGTGIGLLAMLLGFWWRKEIGNVHVGLLFAILMMPNPFVQASFPFNPPAWSLFCELLGNIFYAWVLRFLTLRLLATIMGFCALGLAGILWFGPQHDLNIGWTVATLYGGLFRVGFSFFAGVLLYRLFASKLPGQRHDRRSAAVPWIILGLVAMALSTAQPSIALRPFYDFAAVVFLFPALVLCALWFEPEGFGAKICKFAGSLSYAVYAVHMPLFWLFGVLMAKSTGVSGETWTPWAGFCFIGVLLPFCWFLNKWYDGPLRRFMLARGQSKLLAAPVGA